MVFLISWRGIHTHAFKVDCCLTITDPRKFTEINVGLIFLMCISGLPMWNVYCTFVIFAISFNYYVNDHEITNNGPV